MIEKMHCSRQGLLIKVFLSAFFFSFICINAQIPASPRIPVIDDYFGMKVTDYYRWLENTSDSSVQSWYRREDVYTQSIFSQITKRNKLIAEFNAVDSSETDLSLGFRKDGKAYYFLKRFTKEQRTCLVTRTGKHGADEIIIDFEKEFPGKDFQLFPLEFNPKTKYFAFFIKEESHEGRTIYFYDLIHRRFFPERVRYSFGGTPYLTKFTKDGKGFFYYTLTVANNIATAKDSKAMLHMIGTPVETDKVLASRDHNPELADCNENADFEITVDPQYNYMVLTTFKNDGDYTFIAPYEDLDKSQFTWKVLTKPEEKLGMPLIRNKTAYFLSSAVPNKELVKCRLDDLQQLKFQILVRERTAKLSNLSATKDFLLLTYTNGVSTWLKQYSLQTKKLKTIPLGKTGLVRTERLSENGQEILLTVSGWNLTPTTYLYNPVKTTLQKFSLKTELHYPGVENLVVKEIEVRGRDNTLIPLSLVYDKRTKLNGNAVLQLSGYGAYGR